MKAVFSSPDRAFISRRAPGPDAIDWPVLKLANGQTPFKAAPTQNEAAATRAGLRRILRPIGSAA